MAIPVIIGLGLIGTGFILFTITAVFIVISNALGDTESEYESELLADEELD